MARQKTKEGTRRTKKEPGNHVVPGVKLAAKKNRRAEDKVFTYTDPYMEGIMAKLEPEMKPGDQSLHCGDKGLMCYPGQFCSCICDPCGIACQGVNSNSLPPE